LADFEAVAAIAGLDQAGRHLFRLLGEDPVRKAVCVLSETISGARREQRLRVAPGIGLSAAAIGTPVHANTFFGR
jgi:hypothetical protein